jgi:cell division septum initiation protein DivIVA
MTTSSVDSAGSVSGADDAAQLLADAEEQIEAWLCELDATWLGILADARAEADSMIAAAKAHAAEIVAWAETDANAIRAAAAAAPAADAGHVEANDLAALAAAVEQLRVELSRVVEAAFDALPAVEATAAALRTVDPATPATGPAPRRRGFLRRLTRSRA